MSSLDSLPELKPGLYEHYKGGRYIVLLTARQESDLSPVVVYISLQGKADDPTQVWVRPLDDFTASVHQGEKIVSRFQFIKTLS
ncbi:DUF1653 domain-containing protein [Candidatus Saccharibacteria bacterium]|nr:DUF1653 domain-containing protein [Candidatus Saccharibacteria bacterium]